MPIESRDELKLYFETGDVPTEQQFKNVLESYVHMEDDNLTIYLEPGASKKRLGINNTQPEAELGITANGADEDLVAFNHEEEEDAAWFFDLNPGGLGNPGFNIDQVTAAGKVSRFFIQESDGYIGLGTTTPDQKLVVEASTGGGNGVTGLRVKNSSTLANNGFVIGHGENAIDEQNGALSFFENTTTNGNNRLTIRAGGNVGVSSLIPDTKLHVEMDVALAQADVDLIPGTGIVTIGPMTNNIVLDHQGIQSRSGVPLADTYDLDFKTLNLQRMGGDILIHGDSSFADTSKMIITEDAFLGVGTLTPAESIHSVGAITLGTSVGNGNGTIRYTGSDFEGKLTTGWVSLTGSAPPPPFTPWVAGPGNSIYYLAASDSRVGVGTNTPDCTLDIDSAEITPSGDNIAATIYNHGQAADPSTAGTRINMKLLSNGAWTGRTDIGLYVSEVSGSGASASNIAALLNGNVAIGDVSTSEFLGTGANRVLSIQNGTAPAGPSTTAIAVQIYSADLPGTSLPTLHVMRANGEVVKLYKEIGLPETDTSTITDSYDSVTQGVIENLRERLLQLENRLMNQGLLADPVPVP